MSVRERCFLFHGNDSYASQKAVQRWGELFQAKYGGATLYRVYADELSPEQFAANLSSALSVQPLFAQASLCVISRPTGAERGTSRAYTKALTKLLSEVVVRNDSELTVVLWEDRLLPDSHPLLKWFTEHAEKKQASVRTFAVPDHRKIAPLVKAYVSEQGYTLPEPALGWLESAWQQQEKEQRLAARLRAREALARDQRSWWLYHLLDTAMLAAPGSVVTKEVLEECAGWLSAAVSVFEIVHAVEYRQWGKAKQLLAAWEAEQVEEGNYFVLYTLLRQRFAEKSQYDQEAKQMLRLLADAELFSKNGVLPQAWIADLIVRRLARPNGIGDSLIAPRTVWLSTLYRS